MKRFTLVFLTFILINITAQSQVYESASFTLTPDSSNNDVLIFREKTKPANYSKQLEQPGWTIENWFSTSNYFGMTSDYPYNMYGKEILKLEKAYKIKLLNANYYIPDLENKISPKSFVFLKEDVQNSFKANNIYECLYYVNAFPKSQRRKEFVEQYIMGAQKHHLSFMGDFINLEGFKNETVQRYISLHVEMCNMSTRIPFKIRKDSTYYLDFAKTVKYLDDLSSYNIYILDIDGNKFSTAREKALIAALDNMILYANSTVPTTCPISFNEGKSSMERLSYLDSYRKKLIEKGYSAALTEKKLFEYIGARFQIGGDIKALINKLELADTKAENKADGTIVSIENPNIMFSRPLNSTYTFFYKSLFASSTNPEDFMAIASNRHFADIYQATPEGYYLGSKNELNKYQGKGFLYTSKNGNYLFGNWQNGLLTGTGSSKENNIIKKGDFKDSKLQNGKVEIQYPDGTNYTGEYQNGKLQGKGTLISSNGTYIGYFVNNEYDGSGKLISPDGSWYDGNWKKGNKEGNGTYRTKDGFRFTGNFIKNKPNGKFKVEKWLLSGLVTDEYSITFNMGKPEGDITKIKSELTDFLSNKPSSSSSSNSKSSTLNNNTQSNTSNKPVQKVVFEITRKNVCAYDCIESYELNIIEDSKKIEKITIAKRKDGQWLTYCPGAVLGSGELRTGGNLLEAAKYYYIKTLKKNANTFQVSE